MICEELDFNGSNGFDDCDHRLVIKQPVGTEDHLEFGKRLAGDNPRIHADPCHTLSNYSGDNGQYVTQSKRRAV